jgi:peroxiredoxin
MKKAFRNFAALAFIWASTLGLSAWTAERETTAIDPQADEVLNHMADFYKGLKTFTAKAAFNMLAQTPGSERKVWADYDLAVQRPDKAALKLTGGMGVSVISNGDHIFGYIPDLDKYTEAKAPKTLDAFFQNENLTLVNNSLGNLFLLSQLMRDNPRAAFLDGTIAVKYVGAENLGEVKADHLHLARKDMDLDVWFQQGPQPFILKVAPDIAKILAKNGGKGAIQPGTKIEMALDFIDWNTPSALPEKTFAYSPPVNTQQIPSFFEKEMASDLTGRPAPATNLELMGGVKYDLSQLKGRKIAILGFWATWCEPCVQALPIESEVAREFESRGVVFYAINQRETPETISKFLKGKNLSALNVSLDADGKVASDYGVKGIPFLAIVGKDGVVHYVHVGMSPDLRSTLTKELEKLLSEEAIPTSY